MTPEFAAAVDPILLGVLDLLDRIGRSAHREAEEEMELIQNKFHDAEAQLGETADWSLAKFALVAWIDDVLIEASWPGRNWWENNSLEFSHFKTRERATEFFVKAKEAQQLSGRDALEVFYVCVVLGFRGFYALPDAQFLAGQLQLPTDIQSWTDRAARSIQLGTGRPPIVDSPRVGAGAPPLTGKFSFISTWITTVILAAFVVVVAYYSWWVK